MTKPIVPQVDGDVEGMAHRQMMLKGGKIVGALTAKKGHLAAQILDGKTERIKLNRDEIITREATNRN